MYQTKNLGLNITEMPKDTNMAFSFHTDLGYNFEAIDSKTVTHRNISNCILEIPQRIKYTLENGTLTIKAGSVVIVPYGVEDKTSEFPVGATFLNDNFKVVDTQYADGKFFVWAEVQNDMELNALSSSTANYSICIRLKTNNYSGSSTAYSGTDYGNLTGQYYNTETNIVSYIQNGAIKGEETYLSLPIARVVGDGASQFGTIKQLFNGFGYIGSTIWADKGIKGLAPIGMNEDGTLKNIEHTTSKVITYTESSNSTFEFAITTSDSFASTGKKFYVNDNNYLVDTYKELVINGFEIATVTTEQGVISSFQPKKPFRALDYNDYQSKITELEAKIETLQAAVKALQG